MCSTGGALCPASRKRGQPESFRYPDAKQLKLDQDNSRICLPNVGGVRYRNSREVFWKICKLRSMSRSAVGSLDEPAKNVAAKAGLNKAILDQGWGEFRRQLAYKLAWAGGTLIAVTPHYSSQTCPCCHHISADNRKTQAQEESSAFMLGRMSIKEESLRRPAPPGPP
jgi:transposase